MSGLKKKGPKHKHRNYKLWKDQTEKPLPTITELNQDEDQDEEFDEMKRLMEDAPCYKRHNGAYRQVRHG